MKIVTNKEIRRFIFISEKISLFLKVSIKKKKIGIKRIILDLDKPEDLMTLLENPSKETYTFGKVP